MVQKVFFVKYILLSSILLTLCFEKKLFLEPLKTIIFLSALFKLNNKRIPIYEDLLFTTFFVCYIQKISHFFFEVKFGKIWINSTGNEPVNQLTSHYIFFCLMWRSLQPKIQQKIWAKKFAFWERKKIKFINCCFYSRISFFKWVYLCRYCKKQKKNWVSTWWTQK